MLGVVARNPIGDVLFSTSKTIAFSSLLLEAELPSIQLGLKLAAQLGYSNLLVESDCQLAIKELEWHDDCLHRWGVMVNAEAEPLFVFGALPPYIFKKFLISIFIHIYFICYI